MKILRTTEVGSYIAIVPEITGRAFIIQIPQVVVNLEDAIINGYKSVRYMSTSKQTPSVNGSNEVPQYHDTK